MRIVYVTDAFAVWGGMERVLADKMNALAGQYGWEVTLITTNQGEHPLTYELHPNVRHVDLGVRLHQEYQFRGFKKLLKRRELKHILKNRIKRVVDDIAPDIIVCVKLVFSPVLTDLKGDLPLVVESHTLCHSEKMDEVGILRRLYIRSLKRNIRKADAVVALTEGDADDWKAYNDNVHVIPNVVHLNDQGDDQGDRSLILFQGKDIKRPVPLIYVGRFSKQKDIDSLLAT